ncbi:roadblock/LC7 domain-containing protein [Embleya sp. MST-111070]|uniref:roadblock/LC7 domain-containing protein n=1 Tax=Embleya sp. MST-111070 TaxID=3398231 RepID=UPI003F73795C
MIDQTTTEPDLNWLVAKCADDTPGVRGIVVFSDDGIKTAWHTATPALAEHLAAACTGMRSLGAGVAALAELGSVRQQFVEYDTGYLFLISTGPHVHAAVLADRDVDPTLVSQHSHALLSGIRASLDARRPASDARAAVHPAPVADGHRAGPEARRELGRGLGNEGNGVR